MKYLLQFERSLEPLYKELEERKKEEKPTIYTEKKIQQELQKIYSNLTPYQVSQIARHPDRPHTTDYINALFTDFLELHGDRKFGDDPAIIAGIGYFNGKVTGVIGHRKGRNLKENLRYNFGMAEPEGYRKALRVAHLISERFKAPIITLLDTPGASPTIGAEERGQAEAIAYNLQELFNIPTPIVAIVIGEGGSGGALGIGIADKLLMLKYSIYSVISPEGCASILWRDASKAKEAANALKLTANDLYKLHIVDKIIEEPAGGAHRHREEVIQAVGKEAQKALNTLSRLSKKKLLEKRKEKFINIGVYNE